MLVIIKKKCFFEKKYRAIWNCFSHVNLTIFANFGKISPYFLYKKIGIEK